MKHPVFAWETCFKILITHFYSPSKTRGDLRFGFKNYLIILKIEKLLSPVRLMPKSMWYCITVLLLHSESIQYSCNDEVANISLTVEIWSQDTPSPGCNNWNVLQAARRRFFLRDKAAESCSWSFPRSSYCMFLNIQVFWDAMLCPGRLIPQEYFETSGTTRPVTKLNIPEDVNPQQHRREKGTCALINR
jgi:hypothetical protein